MANSSVAKKLVDLLEKEEKFIILPVSEYEDLVDSSDPSFWKALAEAKADIQAGRVRPYQEAFSELRAHAKSAKHGKSRARSKEA